MKILICCESQIVGGALALALEAADYETVAAQDPFALLPAMPGAGALLVDVSRARQAVALLRDRGFLGRCFVVGDRDPVELDRLAREVGADGALAASPPGGLAKRFAEALELRRRVLIVDDSEIVARLLKEELEAKGFEIQYAPDAETATSIIAKRATRPHLILLDVNMPKVNGAQFCKFVKKNDMFRSIKVVFCTSESRQRAAALAEECGADGYILKDEFLGKWIVNNAG